jgi:hypothetical protein
MKNYDTVVEAINDLNKRGYTEDFNLRLHHEESFVELLEKEKFKIDETYRFEGESNPSDEDIVYAISSIDGRLKGIFTGAFGIYADNSI